MTGGKDYYEGLHARNSEPWNYEGRAAEVLRHERFAALARGLARGALLDIGCSQGQLTRRLEADPLVAFDVSRSAVVKARAGCAGRPVRFLVARLPALPFRSASFDAVVASDCVSEFVPDEEKGPALREIGRVLKPGGRLLIGDYLKPQRFDAYERLVKSHFKIVTIHYLNDRLWYQFESWFKSVRGRSWARRVLSARWPAVVLGRAARLFGKAGSCHILIVAEKEASA